MNAMKGKAPAPWAVVGLVALMSPVGALAHPPMPGWPPPSPPLPSIAVQFPPVVFGAPYPQAPVYHDWAPRHYVHHEHHYYHDHGHHRGWGHHRHGHDGHHHGDWD
jgi:hypothetical protein